MKVKSPSKSGFTLIENVIAMALVSTVCLSFIGAMILAGRMAGWSREAMDAAEILDSKLESLRSHSWTQIGMMFPSPQPFSITNGIIYTGSISVGPVPSAGLYQNELLDVTVTVSWPSGTGTRSLQSRTYISPYGFSADTL